MFCILISTSLPDEEAAPVDVLSVLLVSAAAGAAADEEEDELESLLLLPQPATAAASARQASNRVRARRRVMGCSSSGFRTGTIVPYDVGPVESFPTRTST